MSGRRLPISLTGYDRALSETLVEPALFEGLLWRRPLAYIIDLVLMAALSLATWLVLGLVGVLSFGLLLPIQAMALAALPVLYPLIFLATRGWTPGMRLMDVEVRRWSDESPDLLQAFLAVAVFFLTVPTTGFLILLVALFNERNRTLHDYLSGSVAVRSSILAQRRR